MEDYQRPKSVTFVKIITGEIKIEIQYYRLQLPENVL